MMGSEANSPELFLEEVVLTSDRSFTNHLHATLGSRVLSTFATRVSIVSGWAFDEVSCLDNFQGRNGYEEKSWYQDYLKYKEIET